MASIHRYIWDWTGFVGAPGVTAIYTDNDDTVGVADAFDAWLFSIRAFMPDDVHIRLRPEAEVIDDATGELLSVHSAPTARAIDGANSGPYSAASGMCVAWGTSGLVAGRRVRGRTFLVPMSGAFYDSQGALSDTDLPGVRTGLASFMATAAGHQVIWSRPRTDPVTGAVTLAGSSHPVTSASIRDRVAILRSRRD